MADEDARMNWRSGRSPGVQQAVERDYCRKFLASAGEFQHRLSAHAKADCGDWQICSSRMLAQRLQVGLQPRTVMIDVNAEGLCKGKRCGKIRDGLAVEVGNEGEVSSIR